MKITILLLGFFWGIIGLNAQERVFKDFDVSKNKYQVNVVRPRNFDRVIRSLKADTIVEVQLDEPGKVKMFPVGYPRFNKWHYEIVRRIVPDKTRETVQRMIDEDTISGHYPFFNVNTLIDREGNILTAYFKMTDDVLQILSEEEVQHIYKGLMKEKKVEIMDVLKIEKLPTEKQKELIGEYVMNNLEKWRKNDNEEVALPSFYHLIDILGINLKADYGWLSFSIGEHSCIR